MLALIRRPKLLVVIVVALVLGTVVAERLGYKLGLNTIVRCRDGHLFTTIWIPGASVKSLKLGWWRLQFCPVGRHWTIVTPVRPDDLTEEERASAAEYHDLRLP